MNGLLLRLRSALRRPTGHASYDDVLYAPARSDDWHMQGGERAALMHALARARPSVSIEIGTFRGGSLRPIAAASLSTFTFDLHGPDPLLAKAVRRVEFVTGDTAGTLPPVIARLNAARADLNFILVDGSHETDGVAADINACLAYVPVRRPLIMLMHDSANPAVRKGILAARWQESAHVQGLDLDFVPGMLYDRADIRGEIWGGFALAVLTPARRTGPLKIVQNFEPSRRALLQGSVYSGTAG